MDSGFSLPATVIAQALLGNQTPSPEAVAGAPGAGELASRQDHRHERLTSATVQTLNASGEAAIAFTRTFSSMPAVVCLLIENADSQPIVFKVKSWTQDGGGLYTGCTIKGYRARTLPDMSGLALLTAVISALTSFNVFAGTASGAQFSCVALQVSN